jgi:S1-C subfamily serine protease
VYRRLVHSAVLISTATSTGTGFVVDTDHRLVVTNDHVVGSHRRVVVLFPAYTPGGDLITDRKEYEEMAADARAAGTVVATDRASDLALVRVDRLPPGSGPVILTGEPARPGETVYSVGGSGAAQNLLWRLTRGTVRGRVQRQQQVETGRLDCMVLESDAPINPGDSGGPVLNDRGELVGVVSHHLTKQAQVSGNIDAAEVRAFLARHPDR